jgi:hypothetical protein
VPTSVFAQVGGQPFKIDGTAQLEVTQPKFGPSDPVRLRVDFYVAVASNNISGSITRNVMSKTDGARVVLAEHTQVAGQLGKVGQVRTEPGHAGLPHVAVPGIRLESGHCWPASGLAGAQRRAEQTLAARSSRAPVGDIRARSAAARHCSAVATAR